MDNNRGLFIWGVHIVAGAVLLVAGLAVGKLIKVGINKTKARKEGNMEAILSHPVDPRVSDVKLRNPFNGKVTKITEYGFYLYAHPKEDTACIYAILPDIIPYRCQATMAKIRELTAGHETQIVNL